MAEDYKYNDENTLLVAVNIDQLSSIQCQHMQ